ncbi:S-methyl-5-thioribose-1-phosphate isomerase [Ruminococcaceae bacterium OttesenSCG-928-I18]|nr:S-methyl-5-thioribose-1-phosphate isomerase [Ruminococcaceae bacterium OttesenSCG-928-I18]
MTGKTQELPSADNVRLSKEGDSVVIIDQTKLPGKVETLSLQTEGELFEAIRELRVRGAPAIGIFAAYGLYVLARQIETDDYEVFLATLREHSRHLRSSRPTAVNLSWALGRMEELVLSHPGLSPAAMLPLLEKECRAIQQEDISMCRSISEYGLSLLQPGDGILTHCNAGPLATSCYGTALGPLFLGAERGLPFHVFADETRPLLQGARLTAYELQNGGIDVTLICDNMAATVMKKGWVQACLVGCDRVAANGDVANKIGTSGVAILAKHYGIPFYVLGPSSTFDANCPSGQEIEIELRAPEEISKNYYARPMAPENVKCYNPAFDVTDHTLVTAIVTEKGIYRPPYTQNLAAMLGDTTKQEP